MAITYEVRVFRYAELVAATEIFKEEKLTGNWECVQRVS